MKRARPLPTRCQVTAGTLAASLGLLVLVSRAAALDRPVWQAPPASISGTVTSIEREPLGGARVNIVRVDSRAAWRNTDPPSHPDCGKSATCDADGSFAIEGLDPAARFTVLVEAARYKPRHFLIDPRWRGPVDLKLRGPGYVRDDRYPWATGTLLTSAGGPAAMAVVAIVRGGAGLRGNWSDPGPDPQGATLTDTSGRFRIESDVPFVGQNPVVSVAVYADGTVAHQRFDLPSGKDKPLQLSDGSGVTGRVLRGAVPAPDILVAAVEVASVTSELSTFQETMCDRAGRFVFRQLRPNTDYFIFTPMAPLASAKLATVGREARTGKIGEMTEVGELSLHSAHRVSGTLSITSEPSNRPRMRALLGRWTLPDTQEVVVDEGGGFSFEGVPAESMALAFYQEGSKAVDGYRLSTQNVSLDYLSLVELHGRVDEDLALRLMLEPGAVPAQRSNLARLNPLNPQMRSGPQGPRRVVRKELEPLRGAPALQIRP
jgi:hypothetical protein